MILINDLPYKRLHFHWKNCPCSSLFTSEVSILYDLIPHLVLTKAYSVCWDFKRWIKRGIHPSITKSTQQDGAPDVSTFSAAHCSFSPELINWTQWQLCVARPRGWQKTGLGSSILLHQGCAAVLLFSLPVKWVEMLLICPNPTLRGSSHKADLSCSMGTGIMPLTYFTFPGSEQELKA